ncbi:MAG: hypothetical protein LCH67_18805 [Bacteroidetes bacterium]|nr:hypothetical protein [Bacteroidota bacterium]
MKSKVLATVIFVTALVHTSGFCVTNTVCSRPGGPGCTQDDENPNARKSNVKNNLNWDLLNIKATAQGSQNISAAIEITQTDATTLASDGNSWVVFGGANNTMNMNIGLANNASPQSWSLPTNFQEYFDYYTQDDFIAVSNVPAHLRIPGTTHVARSTYVSDTDEEFEVYKHFNINGSSIDHLGRSFDFDIDDDVFDEPNYEFMDVPLGLGDIMNDTIEEYDHNTDQLLYRTISTLTIDAYGTLTIPGYGTYNCLRGSYQSQYFKRPDEASPFVLSGSSNNIGFMTKQGHFFQAKIVSQNGSNAVLENMNFKTIVPTALLNAPNNVSINNDSKGISISTSDAEAHPSAILDIDSDSLGILIPRIIEANRPVNPAEGLLVYQVDNTPGFYYFDGTAWQKLSTTTPVASISSKNARIGAKISISGKGQLRNGTTFLNFHKPLDDFEDLVISIQLEGDCNGVYISKKSKEGFEVKELKKGKSNVKFSWSLN